MPDREREKDALLRYDCVRERMPQRCLREEEACSLGSDVVQYGRCVCVSERGDFGYAVAGYIWLVFNIVGKQLRWPEHKEPFP